MDMTMILVYTQSPNTHTHTLIGTPSELGANSQQVLARVSGQRSNKKKQKLNKRKLQCYANPAGQHKALNTTSAR